MAILPVWDKRFLGSVAKIHGSVVLKTVKKILKFFSPAVLVDPDLSRVGQEVDIL